MIKLSQIHVPVKHTMDDVRAAAAKELRLPISAVSEPVILKKSIDARRKSEIGYSYSVAVSVPDEERYKKKGYETYREKKYSYVIRGGKSMAHRPVVVGSGPAGLFCTYLLAKEGYRPILLERGGAMEERILAVDSFHNGGSLQTECNVQFGEGGAGTFSDGKLNTLVKDKDGKGRFVLQTFVRHGAPEEILYLNKPHIGTDILRKVIVNMREELIRLGAEVRFHACVEGLLTDNGALTGVELRGGEVIPADVCVLAIGHSSRDTIERLFRQGIAMEPKAFAVGVRIQHKREWVNQCQYGEAAKLLPTADYKLTHTCRNGRGVYSFCMCPGGFVVNASSEEGRLAINGMSNHKRDAANSNSALVVTVTPDDYQDNGDASVLSGMSYQRRLEEAAYLAGGGRIPTQRLEDFKNNVPSTGPGSIEPCTRGAVSYTNLREYLPDMISDALLEGIEAFDRMMPGFSDGDALLSMIESRTSSPVRLPRDEGLQSLSLKGLYPCGEGAGYAGGITSAAMDGIRVFEAIINEYKC